MSNSIRVHILRISYRGGGACTSDTLAAQDARAYLSEGGGLYGSR